MATPIIFGEVLFDVFPDGEEVLGGAPFNVAWHLQGFGLPPLMISRIGTDRRGRTVRERMEAWGMTTAGLQTDTRFPTGTVEVTEQDGQPQFAIKPDQAYDHIDRQTAHECLGDRSASLLYHGTLIARSRESRATLDDLRDRIDIPVFLDINLRPPWWSRSLLDDLLPGIHWLKLNQDELATLSDTSLNTRDQLQSAALRVARRYDLRMVIITRGSEGALLVTPDGECHSDTPAETGETVDTVGAGDAFSAVTIAGLSYGWAPTVILRRAIRFAAAVCGIRGATTDNRNLYHDHLSHWSSE